MNLLVLLVCLHQIRAYVLRERRWHKSSLLTWSLKTSNLSPRDAFVIRNTLHRAFQEWASVSGARFREVADLWWIRNAARHPYFRADIEVAFERGLHNDAYPFDGPDGVAAHTFYPRIGKMHFDADERWTLGRQTTMSGTRAGIDLFQTAVHEIGHLLGIEHSTDTRSVMYPPTSAVHKRDFSLADDDVRAVRALFPLHPSARRPLLLRAQHFLNSTTTTTTTTTIPSAPTTTTTRVSPSPPPSSTTASVVAAISPKALSDRERRALFVYSNSELWPFVRRRRRRRR